MLPGRSKKHQLLERKCLDIMSGNLKIMQRIHQIETGREKGLLNLKNNKPFVPKDKSMSHNLKKYKAIIQLKGGPRDCLGRYSNSSTAKSLNISKRL